MAQKNRGLLVFGSVVVIGAIGYYLWSKSKKSKGAGSLEPTPSDKPIVDKKTETPKDTIKSKPKETPKKDTTPTLLNTTEKVKNFQDWLDTNYPKWLNGKTLNKKGGYGIYGPSTQSAWNTYGTEYNNAVALANAKSQFKQGQFVTAKKTFKGSAVIVRNGKWMTTDGSGIALPQREYRATADLGYVKEILPNSAIILTVPTEIGPTFGTRKYENIIVWPSYIQ